MKVLGRGFLVLVFAVGTSFAAGYTVRAHRLNRAFVLYELYARYIARTYSTEQKEDPGGMMFDTVASTDYRSLMQVRDTADVARLRARLIRFIWRGAPDPETLRPDRIERGIAFPLLANIANLDRIDRMTVSMPLGIDSVALVLHPQPAHDRNCLILYQEGHNHSFLEHKRFFAPLVGDGCTVALLSLPLTGGMNSQPEYEDPRFGHIRLNDPDKLELLERPNFSTLQFFFTPIEAVLNQVLAERSFARVGMAGFSGGGWATVLTAAIDPRIERSYPMSGSVPIAVHAADLDWGSWEQRFPALYRIADYPDLYAMGAGGAGRRQMQTYNLHDPCCFAGRNYQAWEGAVSERAQDLGGSFAVLADEHETYHTISRFVGRAVRKDFLAGLAPIEAAPGDRPLRQTENSTNSSTPASPNGA